jgi:hypothetical protein
MESFMALLIGFGFVAGLGVCHHFGLTILRRLRPDPRANPHRAIVTVFLGLLVLHLAEILAFAAVYVWLLEWDWMGGLGGSFGGSWGDLIYFSGINFATLGYTQVEANGPIRLVNMMQSLGGFMVLTWSATFLYSVCERSWKQ